MFRQLLSATLCAVLGAPAYPSESTLPRTISTASHTYDAETLSKTRVWGSNEKILLHFRATLLLSEKQHWGYEKCRWKNVVGSVVTYDYDAFGNLIHSTGTTPNNYLFAGEQFDPDLNLYYNRARYLNISTGRFWSMDPKRELPRNPNTLHRYKYASSDPVNRIDRLGLEDLAELGATEAIGETLDATSLPANGVELVESVGEETSALAQTETETVANAELEATEEGATAAESQEGEFVEENLSNQRAANYQAKITGQPGQAYKLGNVRFDGLAEDGKTLLEAKGPGYARLLKLPFGDSVKSKLVAQALRQVAAAGGRQIVWHFAEDEAANIMIQALKEVGIEAIKVLVTP